MQIPVYNFRVNFPGREVKRKQHNQANKKGDTAPQASKTSQKSRDSLQKKQKLQHILTAIIKGPKEPLDRDYPFQHLGQYKLGLAVLLAGFKLQSFG